jgi:choline kinase
MRAIILAAGSGIKTKDKHEDIPTCLMEVGGESLLQRQINILKQYDIEEIVVIVGEEGDCWNEKTIAAIKNIANNKVIINPNNANTPSSSSLVLGLQHFEPQTTLVIDGDTIFEKNLIKSLVENKYDNLLFVEEAKGTLGEHLVLRQGEKLQQIKPNLLSNEVFTGLMKINEDMYKILASELQNSANQQRSYANIINCYLTECPFYAKHIEEISGEVGDIINFKPLVGGSLANTKVISKLIKKTAQVVRKEAITGRNKLVEEVKWINNLSVDLKPYFPKILDYDLEKENVWVEMEYHNLPTLRSLLNNRSITGGEGLYILKILIELMFSKFYLRKVSRNPDYISDYAKRIHLSRIVERLSIVMQKSDLMKKIVSAKNIIINGRSYHNIPKIVKGIGSNNEILKKLEPSSVSMVHGDLHFDNFLVDISQMPMVKLILVDPRGLDNTYNYTYDLGKLQHSFHSKYDLFHEGLFELNYEFSNNNFIANLKITDQELDNTYSQISKEFPKILKNIPALKDDPSWEIRADFSEMAHLCSVMFFHMKYNEKERLAIALYLVGVRLANNFVLKHCTKEQRETIFSLPYVNINTSEDFIKAQKFSTRFNEDKVQKNIS